MYIASLNEVMEELKTNPENISHYKKCDVFIGDSDAISYINDKILKSIKFCKKV